MYVNMIMQDICTHGLKSHNQHFDWFRFTCISISYLLVLQFAKSVNSTPDRDLKRILISFAITLTSLLLKLTFTLDVGRVCYVQQKYRVSLPVDVISVPCKGWQIIRLCDSLIVICPCALAYIFNCWVLVHGMALRS